MPRIQAIAASLTLAGCISQGPSLKVIAECLDPMQLRPESHSSGDIYSNFRHRHETDG